MCAGRTTSLPSSMPWPTEDVGSDPSLGLAICRLAMGMDGLYRRTRAGSTETALSAEGLVPVDLWRGEPLGLAHWPAAREAVAALQAGTSSLADPVRRAFVEDTLVSLATIVDWQAGEDGLTFRERAARLLGLIIEPIPSAQLSAWRSIVEPVRSGEELHSSTRFFGRTWRKRTVARRRRSATCRRGR
jgi:hypothetical protein